jgi:Putative adhesin
MLVAPLLLMLMMPHRQAAPLHWTGKMAPGSTLRIFNTHGAIRVTPASGAEAEVDGDSWGSNNGRDPVVFDVDSNGPTITICVYRRNLDRCEPGAARGEGDDVDMDSEGHGGMTDVTVHLPKGVHIHVMSGNGRIDVTDAGADVSASSGNGAVTVDNAAGRVTARSGNGRVEVTTAQGPVNASTGNGAIDVRMARLTDVSDMHFETGNGTITVTLPQTYEGELDANTGHGSISSDFQLQVIGRMSPEHVHASIGAGGGGRLRLETGNGDLVLRKS